MWVQVVRVPRLFVHGHRKGDYVEDVPLTTLHTDSAGGMWRRTKGALFAIGSLALPEPWPATYEPVARSLKNCEISFSMLRFDGRGFDPFLSPVLVTD